MNEGPEYNQVRLYVVRNELLCRVVNLPDRPRLPVPRIPPPPDWMPWLLEVDGAMLEMDELPLEIKLWW